MRLLYVTLSDVSRTPYFELALPALARNGWDITMLAPRADRALLRRVLPYHCRQRNLETAGGRAAKELRIAWELLKARTGPYDVVYLQSAALGARGILSVLGGRLVPQKIVYQTYDYFDPQAFPVHSKLERALVRRTDVYLNAEYHRALVCRALYGYRCPVLITPPVLPAGWPIPQKDCGKRATMTHGESDAFVLMLHGGFSPLRMVKELFEALASLPSRYRLVMTSSGANEPMVEDLLNALNIKSRVVRLGRLDFPEILQYSINADAGLLLYSNNDLGNYFQAPGRLTEYFACGLPVIVSNFVGLENLVLKYNVGLSTDSTSPRDIASSVVRLDQAKQSGKFDASHIRRTFLDHLSFDQYEPEILKVFNRLMLAH